MKQGARDDWKGARDAQAHLSDEEKAVYSALMRVVFALPRVVTAELVAGGGLALGDHLVLQKLAAAPDRQMRMMDLAAACGVSGSGISRIMRRLIGAGLATRMRTPTDMRGAAAVLTAAGAARVAQMHAAHLESIQRHVFEHIGDLDLAALAFGLERVADSMIYAPALAQVASTTTTADWTGSLGDEML
jgi:DNA-binding MarR family transcriptional regulator